jgi:hypothetical protein
MRMQRTDPNAAAEIIGSLVDHNDARYMDHFQQTSQAELEKLDAAHQSLEVCELGRPCLNSEVGDRVVCEIEQSRPKASRLADWIVVDKLQSCKQRPHLLEV